MIDRYTLPEMAKLWSEETKFNLWLKIELLVCDALHQLGLIPSEALNEIKEKATFNVSRIMELEKKRRHDVVAFLEAVSENIGPASRYLHFGLTSSDLLDTALSLQMREAADLILEKLQKLEEILKEKALAYKNTVMIGRTHGVHAEPITLGLKFALWLMEVRRNKERLERAKKTISYGKISGAVGTYAHIPPFVEEYVCKELGLTPAEVSSQILDRDRHAEFLITLAIIAATLEKIATELRHLQRTEVLECEEPFTSDQKGSSAMPHKRNPIICERICGLARVVRSNAFAALENIPLWHERDISHSSVERIIIPDSTILVHYMLYLMNQVLSRLSIYPEKMQENLFLTKGVIFSQAVLLALTKKGLSREEAYQLVQENAMDSWKNRKDFKSLLLSDSRIRKYLTEEEINFCFDLKPHLQYVDYIFKKAGLN